MEYEQYMDAYTLTHSHIYHKQPLSRWCVRAKHTKHSLSTYSSFEQMIFCRSAYNLCVCFGNYCSRKSYGAFSIGIKGNRRSYLYIVTVSIYFYYDYMELFCAQMVNMNVICQSCKWGMRKGNTAKGKKTHTHSGTQLCALTIIANRK